MRLLVEIPQAEIDQAIKQIKRYQSRLAGQVKTLTTTTAINIQRRTKEALTKQSVVIHGRLRSSYVIVLRRDKLGAEVGSSVLYAPYIEFGTGKKVKVPAGLEEYAKQFKGAGVRKVNIAPRPALYPAYFSERRGYIARLKKALETMP